MTRSQIVKFLEFSSLIGFGLAYWKYDLQAATIALMVLMTVFVVVAKALGEPLTKLQMGTWVVVVVLGLATLFFKDERFIKWKTTIINGGLSLALLLSHFIGSKTLMERLLAGRVTAPALTLRRLNLAVVLHLLVIASLNLLFAYQFDTTIWVNFKIFGILALNTCFLCGALYYLRPYLKELMDSMEHKS